jgi:hypothetical protein
MLSYHHLPRLHLWQLLQFGGMVWIYLSVSVPSLYNPLSGVSLSSLNIFRREKIEKKFSFLESRPIKHY